MSIFHPHIPRPSHVLLRSRRLTATVSALAVALAVVAALQPDWLLEVDRPVTDALRGESLEDFFREVTHLGSQQDMVILAAVVGALLWRRCKPFAVALPASVLVGVVLDVTLKTIVDRPRPPDPVVGTALGSFPSGHALTGIVVFGLLPPALWVAFRSRWLFWLSVPLSVGGGLLVVFSRVYLGAHWPSDVVASLFLGASVLLLTEYLLGTPFSRRHCDGCPLHRSHSERAADQQAAAHAT